MPVRAALERYITIGLRKVSAEQDGAPLTKSVIALYWALGRTIGATIRQQLGLDRARALVS